MKTTDERDGESTTLSFSSSISQFHNFINFHFEFKIVLVWRQSYYCNCDDPQKYIITDIRTRRDLADLCLCKLLFSGNLIVHFFVSLQQLYRPVTVCLIFNPISSFTYVAVQLSCMCYAHGKRDFMITGML